MEDCITVRVYVIITPTSRYYYHNNMKVHECSWYFYRCHKSNYSAYLIYNVIFVITIIFDSHFPSLAFFTTYYPVTVVRIS